MTGLDGRFVKAIDDVWAEVARAKSIHLEEFHGPHEGWAVIAEELNKELWELVCLNWRKAGMSDVDYKAKMREEAIQVAAMAVRFAAEVC